MRVLPIALSALLLAAAPAARAEVTHVVQPGHTLEAIAHRYHVTVRAIVEANHLKDAAHIKPGQRLVIPVDGAEATRGRTGGGTASRDETEGPRERVKRGVVDAVRFGEEMRVRVKGSGGRIPPSALKAFEHLMRQGTATHPPDPRLVALIGVVSDHFGGRTIEVVSGYRAYTPTQYTPDSRHNFGRALDFRIRGVKNEDIWAFCRTLRNTGCGYYPNSSFVHLDVRDAKAFWIDRSRPGEPPKYDRPGALADEGASEVPDDRAPPAHSPSEVPGAAGEPSPGHPNSANGSASPLPTDPSSEKSL